MTIKLVLLKSGEDIITNISEMYNNDEVLIGYLFEHPCSVKLRSLPSPDDSKGGYQIGLTSWIPLTKDSKIPVPLDWVITMTNPIDKLLELYKNELDKRNVSNDSSNISY